MTLFHGLDFYILIEPYFIYFKLAVSNLVLTCFEDLKIFVYDLIFTCFEMVKWTISDLIPLCFEYVICDTNLFTGLVVCIVLAFVFSIAFFIHRMEERAAPYRYEKLNPDDPLGQLAKPKPSMIYTLGGTNQPLASNLAKEFAWYYEHKGSTIHSYSLSEPVKAFLTEHFIINDRQRYDIIFPKGTNPTAEARWSKLTNTRSFREGLRNLK